MPGGKRESPISSRRLSLASVRWREPPSLPFAGSTLLSFDRERHPGNLPNTRFNMLTYAFLEFFRACFRLQFTMLLERMHETAPERIEYQPVGDRVHEPARHRADSGEGLEAVSRYRQGQRQCAADAALAQRQEFLDVEVARRRSIKFAQGSRHRGADVALDDDVGSGADRSECADDRLARRVSHDLFGALVAKALLRVGKFLGGQAEHGAIPPRVDFIGAFLEETVDRDDEHPD